VAEGDGRTEPRVKALLRVRLRGAGAERDCCILDVSSRGLLLTTAAPPTRGDFVELIAGTHSLVGHVKWASNRRFGVILRERIDIFALINGDSGSITKQAVVVRLVAKSVAATADESRSLAQMMQFAIVVAGGVAAAVFLAQAVQSGLGNPLRQVSAVFQANNEGPTRP
jgi:hypothetical protein